MTSFCTAGSTENNNAAAGVMADRLSGDAHGYEVMAAAAAIPRHMRREFLAFLRAEICADTTDSKI